MDNSMFIETIVDELLTDAQKKSLSNALKKMLEEHKDKIAFAFMDEEGKLTVVFTVAKNAEISIMDEDSVTVKKFDVNKLLNRYTGIEANEKEEVKKPSKESILNIVEKIAKKQDADAKKTNDKFKK